MLAVIICHDLPEKYSRLLKVVIRVRMIVATSFASNLELMLLLLRVFNWPAQRVRFIIGGASLVSIDVSWAISLVIRDPSPIRAVDRDLVEVGSKPMAVGVWVGEKSSLKHLVVGRLDTWH